MLPGAVEKAMAELTLTLRGQNEEAIRIIKESGLTIIPPPTGKDLEDFRNIHGQVAREMTGKIYPKDVLDSVYKLLGKQGDK
jgi:hypothetical protein